MRQVLHSSNQFTFRTMVKSLAIITLINFALSTTLLAQVYDSQIGLPLQLGQFRSSTDIATDASANFYVLDGNSNVITKFANGVGPILSWGGTGTADGQFTSAWSITTDPSGNVYVVDQSRNEIQKFNSSGTFITKWGSFGTGDGQFDRPQGIAIDASSNVYVVDENNNRVQKFNSSGGFIAKWGTAGSAPGQLSFPLGVAVDATHVYVVDIGNNRVEKYTPTGTYVTQWGSFGAGDGQLNLPLDIATDGVGNIYVSDGINYRIQKFDASGTFLTKWGSSGSSDGQFSFPLGICAIPGGNVLVADGSARIQSFTNAGIFSTKISTTFSDGQFSSPPDVAVDGNGNIYVADGGNNRIQKFNASGVYVSKWGTNGAGDGQFAYPSGIVTDASNNVYVVDANNHRIQKFNSSGTFVTKWGTNGAGDGQFAYPAKIAIDQTGNIYVTDGGNYRVQKFNSSGTFITKWGGNGTADGQFGPNIQGIAVDKNGDVLVVDSQNHRIQKFSSTGTYLAQWGSSGSADGQFSYPNGVATDVNGDIYISDNDGRIQRFSSGGVFISKYGTEGLGNGQFRGPNGIKISAAGNLFVADNGNQRIQKFLLVPAILSFTPQSGPVGTTVIITGMHFSTTAANNIVYFGATKATVTAASTTQLTVTVPVGATYQPITVLTNGLLAYSSKPFVVTFNGATGIDASSFAAKTDFTTGTASYSVSIGDLDGDGKADLAVANRGSNTVSIFRNTGSVGSINYASRVDFATGAVPFSVSIGDLDGDGKADLAVANETSASVSVLRNTSSVGSISFATKVDFTTGTNPRTVSIGDLDGDGKADLAVANDGSGTVSVFRNTSTVGSINYAGKVDFATGLRAVGVSIGEIDGDGKADLAVANYNSGTISVFRNTSSGGSVSFDAKVDFPTGGSPHSVSIGDLDGDGKADLAVANYGNAGGLGMFVSVFRNTASVGSISYAANVDVTSGTFSVSVSIGDLDGDDKADLVVANNGSNTLSVFRNTSNIGSISYAAKVDFTTGTSPGIVSIGDLDGDGKADLVVGNDGSNTVSVFRNTVLPAPTITSFTTTSAGSGTTVTITGTNFTGTTAVSFGGTAATSFSVASATSITAVVASGASGSVSVTTPGGTATLAGFTFIPAPTISSANPTSAGSGTTITITGTNFTGATAVSFGGTAAASFAVVSSTSITAVVATGTSGNIVVTTPGGSATLTGFVFIPSPTISSILPTSAGSGTTVTITGTNFTGATAVSFGGTAATSYTIVSPTSITAVIGSGASGNVSVTGPGGTATLTGFVFIPAPTISSFLPVSAFSGSTVTLTGTNFTGATAVTFGGVAATSFNVVSATSVTAVVGTGATGSVSIVTPGGTSSLTGFTFTFAPIQITESFVSTYDKGSSLTVSITLNDALLASAVNFKSRGITEAPSAIATATVLAAGNKFEVVIPANDNKLKDPIGLIYWFEVLDKQSSPVAKNSSTGKAYVHYTSSSSDQAFPGLIFGNQLSNYQIIAVPLDLTNKNVTSVFSTLIPYDKTKWRLFEYASNDNREFGTSGAFTTIDPGKGYWLIVKDSRVINPGEGKTVQADDASPFTISLAAGWNLIGNPYNFNLLWQDVLDANTSVSGIADVDKKLTTLSGSTLSNTATVLPKYRGAFVKSTNAIALKIPVKYNSAAGRVAQSDDLTNSIDQKNWEVKLVLHQDGLRNEMSGIGMNPKASLTGKDEFDKEQVPLPFEIVELSSSRQEMATNFAKDIVPTQENFTWDFDVEHLSEKSDVELTWANDYFGDNDKQLILFDPSSLQAVDMRLVNHFILTDRTKKLRILFGGNDYVQGRLDKELPWLGSPFPNPAKAELTIPFRVPETNSGTTVQIKIYNGLGAEVVTLLDQDMRKGSYEVKWNSQTESGLYIVRMKIGQQETKAVKVIINK